MVKDNFWQTAFRDLGLRPVIGQLSLSLDNLTPPFLSDSYNYKLIVSVSGMSMSKKRWQSGSRVLGKDFTNILQYMAM